MLLNCLINSSTPLCFTNLPINKKVKVFESKDLNINSKKVYKFLDWSPSLSIENAVNLTIEWYRAFKKKQDLFYLTKIQILNYFKKMDSI